MASVSLPHLAVGTGCLLVSLAARAAVVLTLSLYRTLGLPGLAGTWERGLSWWIPTVRIVAGVLALGFLMRGLGIL
ncbi:MAG: hypothetical protein AAB075_02770 [Gemmatimonadota bacterium]